MISEAFGLVALERGQGLTRVSWPSEWWCGGAGKRRPREARGVMTEPGDTEAPRPSVARSSAGGAERIEERGRGFRLRRGRRRGDPSETGERGRKRGGVWLVRWWWHLTDRWRVLATAMVQGVWLCGVGSLIRPGVAAEVCLWCKAGGRYWWHVGQLLAAP